MTGVLCKTHVCVRRNDSAGQRGWWRLAWNCIIRLGTSRISMSCIFHEARSRGGNHIAFGSPDAVPSLSLLSPPPLLSLPPAFSFLRGNELRPFSPLPLLFFRALTGFLRVEANFDSDDRLVRLTKRKASFFWAMTRDQSDQFRTSKVDLKCRFTIEYELWNGVTWYDRNVTVRL